MIEKLRLQDFKSFRDVTVPFGRLTLIVGANAAGKSNLRDALRLLKGLGAGFGLADVVSGRYLHGGETQWRGIRGGIRETPRYGATCATLWCYARASVDAGRTRGSFPLCHKIRIDFSDERVGPRTVEEALWNGHGRWWDIIFNSHSRDDPIDQREKHQIRVRGPRGGDYRKHGPAIDLSSARAAVAQFPDQKKSTAEHRHLASGYLDLLQSIRFLDLDPEAMRTPSPASQSVLGPRGENLSSVLQGLCRDDARKGVLRDWLQALTPLDVVDFAFETDFAGRVMVFLVEADGNKTSAYSASDGTLRFLAMVAALLSSDSGRIYVFEELDNGIHPTRLHLLLDLIERACREQQVQVIGTTHNPAILSFLSDEARQSALLVHRPEGLAESRVTRLMALPDIERVLEKENLGELLTAGWLDDAAFFAEGEE